MFSVDVILEEHAFLPKNGPVPNEPVNRLFRMAVRPTQKLGLGTTGGLSARAGETRGQAPATDTGRQAACATRQFRYVNLLTFLALAAGMFGLAAAAEPAPKDAKPGPASQRPWEGLGFSVAPETDGKARTSLFGLVGEGYKFVYVFDRSGSMGGDGRNSLRALKAELLRSLKNLDTVHQFQIIFYNEHARLFNPSGEPGHLAFATDANKQRAVRFIESITAEGGTNHEEALRAAIRLRPDVIFFLTDADDPKLTPGQLEKIRSLAAGIIINAIEFGPGPQPAEASFLADLARQNGGGYVYVDVSKRDSGVPAAKPGP